MSFTRFSSRHLRQDIAAGFVVFLIALPLSLGIAIASDAPAMSGIVAGIVAGLLVTLLSGSEISVSGPAAGLAAAVVSGQLAIGSFDGFLVATMLAGAFQVIFGLLRTGKLASLIPNSVVQGMVAGIGLIIMFRQTPHALGLKGDLHFEESIFCAASSSCAVNSLFSLHNAVSPLNEANMIIFSLSLAVLTAWDWIAKSGSRFFTIFPSALAAVIIGTLANLCLGVAGIGAIWGEDSARLVNLPVLHSIADLFREAPELQLSWLKNPVVWETAFSLAVIASIQSLLSLEAGDKLDPSRRVSQPNRELIAQGCGNLASGILGGLPITTVVVRTSANIYAGAHSRLASFSHGILLVVAIILFPSVINQIPLASLAAILLAMGFRLAHPQKFRRVFADGLEQSLPFSVTLLGVIILDVLSGVLIGTALGLLIVLKMNYHSSFTIIRDGNHFFLRFAKDVSFVQKGALRRTLANIPDDSTVFIECGGAMFIDHDIRDVLEDFGCSAGERNINVSIRNMYSYRSPLFA